MTGNLRRFHLATAFLLAAVCDCALATDHEGGRNFPGGSGGVNAPYQIDKPYLILVSIDGFRWDYMDLHELPTLQKLAREGVRVKHLVPVFPTLTFPNHYSIATGLYPARHGLVANDFPLNDSGDWYRLKQRKSVENGSNYRGEPIWVTAETQGMVTASYFWVGTEADIMGVRPTHWRSYDKGVAGADRVDQVLDWLALPVMNRPHFYTLYFEDVDDYTHWYGIESSEAVDAMNRVDDYVSRLLEGLKNIPHGDQVNLILLSDHGQTNYGDGQALIVDELIDLDGISTVDGGSYLFLHLDQPDRARAIEIRDTINSHWSHGRAWLPEDAPKAWQVSDDPRFPDVIIVADVGHGVLSTASMSYKAHSGDHGWAPEADAMHGFFVASGPAFRQGLETGSARNIDVYPLLLNVLGLTPPGHVDGDPQVLADFLR